QGLRRIGQRPFWGRWEHEGKCGTLARDAATLDPDAPAHGFDQDSAHVQANSGSTRGSRDVALETHEAIEKLRDIALGDAKPIVARTELDLTTLPRVAQSASLS